MWNSKAENEFVSKDKRWRKPLKKGAKCWGKGLKTNSPKLFSFSFVSRVCVSFKVGTAVANHDRRMFRVIQTDDDGPIDHEADMPRSEFHKADVKGDTSDITAFINKHKHIIMRRQLARCPVCDTELNPCANNSVYNFKTKNRECKCSTEPYCNTVSFGVCTINATWLVERLEHLTKLCP